MKQILTEKIDAVQYVGTAESTAAASDAAWSMERYVDLGTEKRTPRKTHRFQDGGDFTNTQTKSNPCGSDGAASTAAAFKWDDRATLFWDGDDTGVPTLASAVRTDDTHVTVTMSETCAVDTITKSNAGGFTVNETGAGTTYAVSAIAPGATNAQIVLTVANLAVSAKEGVTVKYATGGNGTVKDSYGNALATNATGVNAPAWDVVAPTMASAARVDNVTVELTMSEFMDSASVTKANAGGFVVKETGTPATAYSVSAVAPGLTADKVVLTVADMGVSGKEGVTVTYAAGGNGTVADVGGTALATNAVGVAVTAWDLVSPTMASAVVDSNTQITVTMSEDMAAASVTKANAGGFVVADSVTPATTYAVSAIAPGSNADEVVLTVASVAASALNGMDVTYASGGNGTATDVAGNALATDATGVAIAAWDAIPTMLSSERIANTTLRVTLSEDADTATTTKANDGGFVVYETGTPATTYAVSAIAPNGGNHNQVDLTVASVLASAAVGVTITYVKGGNGTVADDTGNLLETDATGVLVAAW